MYIRWMAAAAAAGLMLAGCDRLKRSTNSPDSASVTTGGPIPSNPPTSASPSAELPATTFPPALRSMTVAEGDASNEYEFPPAHLHIDRQRREVFLYSQDPSSADNPSEPYSGNSYYLPLMTENFDEFVSRFDAHQLDKFELRFKSSSGEFDDSALDGIYLAQRYRLQASSGTVRFAGNGQVLRIVVDGKFLKFDTDEDTPAAAAVTVEGTVMTIVDAEKIGEPASQE